MPRYVNPRYQGDWGAKGSYFDKDIAVKIVPAPVGGWDSISPLAAMEPKYAASIINWVPRPGWVELRGGYNAWCQNLSTQAVNSLLCYKPNTGMQKLFAATGTQVWDVSSNGVPTVAHSPVGGDKYQYVNFTPSLGLNYLLTVNGVDSNLLSYNGTAWAVQTITGAGSAIFAGINIFKRRVWLIPINSTIAYFLGTDAITGAATAQDLGPFMSKGGYLMAMGTWTVDGGQGPDDLAVFITSEGQAIIYKGTDPTNANAWQLVGVFDLPRPIGRRCFLRWGSDLLLITMQGVLPVSQSLPFDPSASRSVAITNRIQNAMTTAAQMYNSNYGWQLITFPQQYLLFLNIPQVESATQVQYVQNALTGAWTQFNGWNANCFEIYNDSLFFGDNSAIWDSATWSTGTVTVINWLSCNALGTALAVRMIVNVAGGGTSSSLAASSVFDTGVFDTMIFDGNGAVTQSGVGMPVLQINVFELSLEYGGPV